MAETYITLNEAAELEAIGYETMKKRIHRNPEKFLITKEQRETGGKEMTMVAISSLSRKARTAWKEREKLKAVAEAPVQEADQAGETPWYVEEDIDWYIENRKEDWYKAMELGNIVREFLEYDERGRTEFAETFAQERLGKGKRTLYRYTKAYQEASAWADKMHKQLSKGACVNKQCLFPKPCKNLVVEHKDYISLLRKLRKIPSVKKVFIRSGIRFDYCMEDSDDTFLRELCENHISGQLRVAPEHISDKVLSRMGKPSRAVYDSFIKRYKRINDKTGKEQFVVPYLMSSHPGSTMKEAIELAEYVRDLGYMPEQVQDFYPTPSTLSTCMYYTGYDPRTMEKVYTPVSHHEKEMQRALIQYKKPENYDLVKEALLANNRNDLIGFGPKCLIPPRKIRSRSNEKSRKR